MSTSNNHSGLRGISLTEFTSGRNFVLPNVQEQVHEKTDLELVTWLVIKEDKA